MLKKIVASMALAITALATVMSLAHADALDDIKKAGKIRIAIDLGVPPYGMTDDKLQPTGLDVETARLLAKDWGTRSTCRPQAPANCCRFRPAKPTS